MSDTPQTMMNRWMWFMVVSVIAFACRAEGSYPPAVTVRWIDPSQVEQFAVESPTYSCRVATAEARINAISVGGVEWLKSPLSWRVIDENHVVHAPASLDVLPQWDTWQGQSYKPAKSSRARMNVWSAGPYYWDAHLLDIPLIAAGDPQSKPLRGEVVFHAHPDQLRIHFKCESASQFEVSWPGLTGQRFQIGGRAIIVARQADVQSAMLLPAGASADMEKGLLKLPARGATLVIKPFGKDAGLEDLFADDLDPLPASAFVLEQARYEGYDDACGFYRISTAHQPEAFTFEESYRNPGRRIASRVEVRNDGRARKILLKTSTGVGNLEAAVLADETGFPLPIPAQVSKNFAGEKEEPDDKAFGDSYVPLNLSAGETRQFRLFHLTHGYGLMPLKQVSSVRFFHIYWHLSTGASETTCFTMNWMEAGWKGAPEKTYFHIPDYRPLSGPFWPGQPQHHCAQFPGFLQYNGDVRLVYDYTTFDSISPLLARFTMHFHTSDDAAKATLSIMEIPQTDEMRTFIRLRYDFIKPLSIQGDARESFKLVNIFEFQTPQRLLWLDTAGTPQATDVIPDQSLMLKGVPLAPEGAYLASHRTEKPKGDSDFQSLLLVRGFRAKLGGKDLPHGAMSARFSAKAGSYWLTTDAVSLTIQPGDFFEADLMLMPHGEPAPEWLKPQRERTRFATSNQPRVASVTLGEKTADFPATLNADANAAAFHLSGGENCLPIIIEGADSGVLPLFWERGTWQSQQLHGGDDVQIEPGWNGKNRWIFARRIREGQTHEVVISAVSSATGIASLRSENGRLTVASRGKGTVRLEAPVVFGPGDNIFNSERKLFKFEGDAELVRQLPIELSTGRIRVLSWDETGGEAIVEGPATLTAGRGWTLFHGTPLVASATLKIPQGQTKVSIRPKE